MNPSLVLASSSPRRKALLSQAGFSFTVDPADVDERVLPGEGPEEHVLRLAREKARVVAGRAGAGVIVAADTVVALGRNILGKPAGPEDASRMLSLLSGRDHQVITGLAVMDAGGKVVESRVVTTRVWFRMLRDRDIASYVATGEPLDKAGAYGIQERGCLLVDRIEGCYFNVVGLPIAILAEILERLGVLPGKTEERSI